MKTRNMALAEASKLPLALVLLIAALGFAPGAFAKIPEPHHVVYGTVTVDGAPATRGVVELTLAGSTEPIATYVIGSQPGAEGMYVLRVPIDALYPRVAGTAQAGDAAQIFVNGLWGADATIGEKGTFQEVPLDAISEHRIVFRAGPAGVPNPVDSGGTAGVGVLARDTLGHALSYAWSAMCPGLSSAGSFADGSAAATLWTAPSNLTGSRQGCTISVTVSDGQGLIEARSYSQNVTSALDRVVLVSGPSGTPNPVASAGAVTLAVAAEDTLGHAVSFSWSAVCPGLGSNGSFATAEGTTVWTAPGNFTGEQKPCTLLVSASDGFGHGTQGFYVQKVEPDPHAIIISSPAAGMPNPVRPGGVVDLAVTAIDSQGHQIAYAWRALCVGLAGNGAFDDATLRTPRWTAPAKTAPGPAECRMEVQLSDGQGASRVSWYRQVVSDGRPVAVAAASASTVACPAEITFDGSGSYHPSPARRIVKWEWDFHYDGGRFRVEGEGPTVGYTYGDVGAHTVALRVSDDAAVPMWDIATLEVTADGSAPTASAGGPYAIGYGAPLALDAAASADQDAACGDRVTEYAWDLDDDGEFDDAAGAKPLLGWWQVRQGVCGGSCEVGMTYPVAVRVTDRLGYTGEASAQVTIGGLDVPIRLGAPNGGEVLGTGTGAQVRFVSDASVDAVKVLLSRGGSGIWQVVLPQGPFVEEGTSDGGTVLDGSRVWRVPLALGGTSRDYAMKVVGYADGEVAGADESDGPFGIGPVEVTAPKPGEELLGGRRAVVRWNLFKAPRPVIAVRVKYSLDDGASWRLAGFARPGSGQFTWRVPVLRQRNERCRVMAELLSATGSVLGRDAGAGAFTISGGAELTGPEAGDVVYGGAGRLVTWSTAAVGPVARVALELSSDAGATWAPVATVPGNPGEYAWDAPEVSEANAQCRLAVTLYNLRGGVIARDEGEGLFTIVPLPAGP